MDHAAAAGWTRARIDGPHRLQQDAGEILRRNENDRREEWRALRRSVSSLSHGCRQGPRRGPGVRTDHGRRRGPSWPAGAGIDGRIDPPRPVFSDARVGRGNRRGGDACERHAELPGHRTDRERRRHLFPTPRRRAAVLSSRGGQHPEVDANPHGSQRIWIEGGRLERGKVSKSGWEGQRSPSILPKTWRRE